MFTGLLPRPILEDLKLGKSTEAEKFDCVSILFRYIWILFCIFFSYFVSLYFQIWIKPLHLPANFQNLSAPLSRDVFLFYWAKSCNDSKICTDLYNFIFCRYQKSYIWSFHTISLTCSDFVDFYAIVETCTPNQVIETLHYIYGAFDNILLEFDAHKIETIGNSCKKKINIHFYCFCWD